jgi:4'-phosphopantetheinyl transferase
MGKYYIGVVPEEVEFCYGKYGKPYLAGRLNFRRLYFNQVDSNGLGVYAFRQIGEVAVDVEHMRSMPGAHQIVNGSLSGYEKEAFKGLSSMQKHEAFFNCWTRKEAFIKAVGLERNYIIHRISSLYHWVQTSLQG